MAHDESGAIKYEVTPLNFSGEITLSPYLNGDISNKDSNHGEKFWNEVSKETSFAEAEIILETKQSKWASVPTFQVCTRMKFEILKDNIPFEFNSLPIKFEKYVGAEIKLDVVVNQKITLIKYAVNFS
jgi:maltose phosphorylase